MPDAPHPRRDAAWRIHDGHAETLAAAGGLRGPAGQVRVDLTAPAHGLVDAEGDRILGIDFGVERPPRDAWTRGDDLVATWESGDERDLVTTALWRRHVGPGLAEERDVAAFVVVASATTRLLQADATLAVTSSIAADSVLSGRWEGSRPGALGAAVDPRHGIHLLRRAGARSVLVAIHPSDHQATTIERGGGRVRLACWLFPAGVEKGVLLRSRVLAAVGPAQGDVAWAERIAARFAALPPELST